MKTNKRKAWTVLIAGVLFNLSIGSLYTWSIIRGELMIPVSEGGWGWTSAQAGLPFTVAIVAFAIGLLVGGRIQDKIGPRWIVTFGGFLVGLGMIISSLVGNSPTGIMIGFGIVSGAGIGFGYGCVTPPALKWFHFSRKGMVSALIVGGFGFGAVYYGPITKWMLSNFGIEQTFMYFGMIMIALSVPIAQFIKNPPADYVPEAPKNVKISEKKKETPVNDYFWRDMIKTPRFYMMFVLFMIISSVGLMVIGNVTRIAGLQAGISEAGMLAFLVSFTAITNMLGRIIGGMISDRIGQINTIFIIIGIQIVNMIGFSFYNNLFWMIIGIIGIGLCFGALLAVFPALTAEQFGLKNYGANYGIVYLAWGLSGVVAPVLADFIYDQTGSFTWAYIICVGLMVAMLGVNVLLQRNVALQKKEASGCIQESSPI